jgi:hypothetical protein
MKNIELGRALRDDGARLALENAGEEWKERATTLVLKYFDITGDALFEDAREYAIQCGVGSPPSPNSWGAVALSLSKKNLITKTGVLLPSKAVKSHGRSQPVWRTASNTIPDGGRNKREWQGLTDEEIMEMLDYGQYGRVPQYARNFVDAIEAKLKEKNT